VGGTGSESQAVAMARLQADIDNLQERLEQLQRQVEETEAARERRHAELRDEVRRAMDAQAHGLAKLAARVDSAVAGLAGYVSPEMAQRLAESRAREAASRAWAVALLGALAIVVAAILTTLKR
jgi:uncharacterized protein YlxW (UPF0749 family)